MRSACASTSEPVAPVSGFVEPRPDVVAPNPGGPDDPLGESVAERASPWLRVFTPRDVRLVIGRHQDPARELVLDAAAGDGIPIHRRICGGGAVALAPGMVVIAVRMVRDHLGTTTYLDRVNRALARPIAEACGVAPEPAGLGDIAMREQGALKKVLGASLRQSGPMALYLGCLLIADEVPLMERYLRMPSREPAYRGARSHRDFCTHLGRWGARVDALRESLASSLAHALAPHALLAES
jgi:lipoate-protein ligase A